jgi:hypothetical protein
MWRMGGTMGIRIGPVAPTTTDQKKAGRSRAAQPQYLRGVDQKRGADIVKLDERMSAIG